jgi:hypothetical protein
MEAGFRGAYREFTADSIFSDEVYVAQSKKLWCSRRLLADGTPDPQNSEAIQVYSSGINIVSSADARVNSRKSLGIALDLAAQGLRVLYVNNFASVALLREYLKPELERVEADIAKAALGEPTANPVSAQSLAEVKSRFHIMDCKMGMWDSYRYHLEHILFEEKHVSYGSEEKVLTQKIDVLVMTSFEFSAVTYRQKLDVATAILQWISRIDLTAVIFTQENQEMMEAGLPVRGPLGLLTSAALSVSKIGADGPRRKSQELFPDTNVKLIYSAGGDLVSVELPTGYSGGLKSFDDAESHIDPESEPFRSALRRAEQRMGTT